MNLRYTRTLRIISAIVLCFFTWTFGGLFDIAYAVDREIKKTSTGNQQPKVIKPEEKFEKTLNELEQVLADTSIDTDTKKNKVKVKKSEIETLDVEIKKQFSDTEKKLKDEGLPQDIIERHYSFVNQYETNLNELKNNLDKIEKAKDKKEADEAIENTKKFLEKVKPPKKHVPLDPNKLPHRTLEPVFTDPREKPEEFTEGVVKQAKGEERRPILVASNGPLSGLLSANTVSNTSLRAPSSVIARNEVTKQSQDSLWAGSGEAISQTMLLAAANPPTSAELAETIEVKFTPAIQAKAQELGHNPTKIYNWVRNNIEYVPTYGSIQGADMCLQTKQCNDFDTASLLIALLRASGIHARYVYGTVEIPMEKVKNWLGGFTDSMASLNLLASAKIPVKGMTVGGEIKYVRIEHIWVEAYIDYIPSRGARHKAGKGDTWIPLDASFKQYTYKEPMDLPQALGFNAQNFVDEVLAGSTIDPINSSVSNVPQALILQRMQEYVQGVHQYYDTNLQGKTVEDIAGSKKVVAQDFPYLLGTLPYKTITVGNKYSQLPDSLRWRINFQLSSSIYSIDPDFSYTASTASFAGKSITLSYKPSTTSDEALVQKYGYIEKVPPYLLNLTPELIIGGEVKASGIPVGSGRDIDFVMTFTPPKGTSDIIRNKETAGAYLGIGLDLGWLSKSVLDKEIEALNQIYNEPSPSPNRKIQEWLSLLASVYFAEVDAMNIIGERFAKIVDVRLPSAAIVGEDMAVKYVFGSPLSQSFAGLFIDVDRDVHTTQARDGDKNRVVTFNMISGMNGSAMEHSLWEHLYELPGVSAVKVLQLANEGGIPIYKIEKTNISSIISALQISGEIKSDIINAVNAGKIVYVPQRNIQYYAWNGTAYIVVDINTGVAGYIISGGLSGGNSLLDCVEALVQLLDLIPWSPSRFAQALEIVTYAATIHDISQATSTTNLEKGMAALLAGASLIVGLYTASGEPSLGIVVAVTITEVFLYASIYYLIEGEIPFIDMNPLKPCCEFFESMGINMPGCEN